MRRGVALIKVKKFSQKKIKTFYEVGLKTI